MPSQPFAPISDPPELPTADLPAGPSLRRRAFLTALASGAAAAGSAGAEKPATERPAVEKGYASVNGLKMYYEVHGAARGDGSPLVLLHGGGSTIETSFGAVLPQLARVRRVIAFEQQGHGRTADVDRPFSFEQSADDAAALLRHLQVPQADLWGYSNGGNVAMQVAVRHPALVRRLVIMSSMSRNDGLIAGFHDSLKGATPDNMPAELREAYRKSSPHPEALPQFVTKCVTRMLEFQDWPDSMLRGIAAPALVLIGDADVVRPEHAVEMFRLLPAGQLAILPATDHMQIIHRTDLLLPLVSTFLDAALPASQPR